VVSVVVVSVMLVRSVVMVVVSVVVVVAVLVVMSVLMVVLVAVVMLALVAVVVVAVLEALSHGGNWGTQVRQLPSGMHGPLWLQQMLAQASRHGTFLDAMRHHARKQLWPILWRSCVMMLMHCACRWAGRMSSRLQVGLSGLPSWMCRLAWCMACWLRLL
jgi:hypothetical protein